MDVDAITRLIVRIVPSVAEQAFAAREQWDRKPSESDARLIHKYLELIKGLQVLGQYRPIKSFGSAMAFLDQVQQYSLLYSGKLSGYEPSSLLILAVSVAVRRFREKWKPVVDEGGGTGSTTPGLFGALTEDIGELTEKVAPLTASLDLASRR